MPGSAYDKGTFLESDLRGVLDKPVMKLRVLSSGRCRLHMSLSMSQLTQVGV